MTGGYHIINATGTVIKVRSGNSDNIIFDGTLKNVIDAIKNNKIIVLEGQKVTRDDGVSNVETGVWVLNFVHNFTETDESTVDAYIAVVEAGAVRITITLDWEEGEFTYSVSAV